MRLFKKFIFFIIFFLNINFSYGETNIVYLDLDFIFSNSLVGKYINSEIEKQHKQNLENFKKEEKALKDEEIKIVSQRNILKNDEFEKKINELRNKVNLYRKNRQALINNLNQLRINSTNKILQEINPILTEYSKKNSISMIVQKKYIVVGKSELNITQDILDQLNNKIKKIELK